MTGGCFFDDGLMFSCTRCSRCCRGEPGNVFLSRNDLTKLAEWFSLKERAFAEKYCRKAAWRGGDEVVSLIEKENGDCVFWRDGTGCAVYGARPVQCETYPFWRRIVSGADRWEGESRECPGIGGGKLWSKSDILSQMQRHALNRPLLWKEIL